MKYSHEQPGALESIVQPWIVEEDDAADALQKKLAEGQTMSAEQRRILVANPMARVVKVTEKMYT